MIKNSKLFVKHHLFVFKFLCVCGEKKVYSFFFFLKKLSKKIVPSNIHNRHLLQKILYKKGELFLVRYPGNNTRYMIDVGDDDDGALHYINIINQ